MKSSKRASTRQSKNTRSKSKKTDAQSLAHSDDDKSSMMDIESTEINENLQAINDEMSCEKKENPIDLTNAPEFKIELPQHFDCYENFVSKIDPLLQQVDSYIRNDGLIIASQIEPQKIVHVTGALLQSILKFNQSGRKIEFILDEAKIKQKEGPLSQQAYKPVLKQLKTQSKSNPQSDLVIQEFVLTNQDEFDPFVIYDEKNVLMEIEYIIKEYESLFNNSDDSEHRVSYFNKKFNRGELNLSEKPKKSLKKKSGPEQTSGEDEILRAKSQLLLNDIRREVKGNVEQFSQTSSTTSQLVTGGEILFSTFTQTPQTESVKKQSSEELQLREALISEYNSPTESGLQNILSAFIARRFKRLKISIHTAILLSIVYNLSIRRQGTSWSDSSISNNIALAGMIPFPTTPTLHLLNCKYFIAKALDIIMNAEIENCIPRSAYFPAVQEFDCETHQNNEKSAQLCSKLIALYRSETLQLTTETSAKLSLYHEQLLALNKIFKMFAPQTQSQDKENMSPQKANSNHSVLELETLMNEIRNIPGLTGFAEYQHFSQAHLMSITGGLIISKNTPEEWVSPKFGCGSESKTFKNSSLKKELKSVMQDFNQILDSDLQKDHIMVSAEKSGNYYQAFDGLNWSFQKEIPRMTKKTSTLEEIIEIKDSPEKQNNQIEIEIEEVKSPIRCEEMQNETRVQENEMQIEEEPVVPEKTKKKRNTKKSVERPSKEPKEEDAKSTAIIDTYLTTSKDPQEKKIVKEYSKRLNTLLKKPLLSETESRLMETEQTISTGRRKKNSIEEQVQKAKSWLQEYNQQVLNENKSIDQIQELVDEIESTDLRVPEMEVLLIKQLELELWRYKVESALRILEQKRNPTSKAKSSKKIEQELLSVEDLESILAKAGELKLNEDFEPGYYELRRKLEDIRSIQRRHESSENDLNVLRKLSKELIGSDVSFPNLESELQRKIELNEQVINALEAVIPIDRMEKLIHELKNKIAEIDPVLYFQLCQKGEDAAKIQASVQDMSKTRDTYECQLVKEMNDLISEVNSLKIEVAGLNKLEQIVAAFYWLMKLDKTRRGDQVPEMTFGEPTAEYDNNFDPLEDEIEINEVVETCQKWILKDIKPGSVTQHLRSDLEQLIRDGESITFYDNRVQTVFDGLRSALKRLSNGGHASEEKYKPNYVDQEMMEEESSNDGWNTAEDAQMEIQSSDIWRNNYKQVVFDEDLEGFLRNRMSLEDPSSRNATMNSIKSKLARLLEDRDVKFEKLPEFSEKIANIKKFISWINWFSEAEACTRNLEEKSEKRLNELRKLNDQALEFDVPKSWALYNQVKKLLALADQVLAEYYHKFDTKAASSPFKSAQKESIHKLIEKNKGTPYVSEAELMKEELIQTLYFIDCEAQLSELDRKIKNYASWKEKLISYMNNEGARILRAAMEPDLVLEDLNQIEQKLSQLSSEFVCLGLRAEQDEKLLEGLECQMRAYLLVKNLSKRPPTVDEWKRVLEYIEENPELDPTDQKGLIDRMKAEIEQATTQSQLLRDLQNLRGPDDRIPLENLKNALHESQNALVRNPDDEQFVSELIQKVETLVRKYEALKTTKEKAPATEFTKILEEFKLLSVAVPDKENEIEEVLNLANRITSFIRKYILMDLKSAEDILQQYKSCPIFVLEAERLQSKYNSSKELYEKLKETLNNTLSNARILSYGELEEIAEELDDVVFDFEGNLPFMKALAYTFRIEYLQKIAATAEADTNGKAKKRSKNSDTLMLTPQAVKSLAKEGQEIQKAFKQNSTALNQAVKWMNIVLHKSEDQLKEISEAKKLSELKKIQPVLMGFIDFQETINERKLRISSEQIVVEKPSKKNLLEDRDDVEEEEEEKKVSKEAPVDQNDCKTVDYDTLEKQIESQEDKKTKRASQPKKKKESSKAKPKESSQKMQEEVPKKEANPAAPSSPLLDKKEFAKVKDLLKPLKDRPMPEKPQTTKKQSQKEASKKESDSSIAEEKKAKKEEKEKPKPGKALKTLQEILKDNLILSLDDAEALNAARRFVKHFPILQKSNEKLEKFATQLKKILTYPNICSFLSEKDLCPKEIFKLLTKSSSELAQFEDKLEKACQPKARKPLKIKPLVDEEDLGEKAIKKKPKTDQHAQATNVIEAMITELAKKLEPKKESSIEKIFKAPEPKPVEVVNKVANHIPEVEVEVAHTEDYTSEVISKSVLKSHEKEEPLSQKQKSKHVTFQMEEEVEEEEEFEPKILKKTSESKKKNGFQFESERPKSYKKEEGFRRMEFETPRERAKHSFFGEPQHSRSSVQKERTKPALKIPLGSALKIFDGTIKGIEEVPAENIGLYTCDSAEKVTQFPKILTDNDNSLRIQGRMDFARIEPYVNRFMATFDDKKEFIMSGWVESFDEDCQTNCENMALRFLLKQKVGMLKFYECAKIFFLHERQFRPEWLRWLKFQKKDLKADSHSTLRFLFIYRPAKFPFDVSALKKIEPEVVVPYEDKLNKIRDDDEEIMDFGAHRIGKSSKNLSDDELEFSLSEGIKQLEQNLSLKERKKLSTERHQAVNSGKTSIEKKISAPKAQSNSFAYSKSDLEVVEELFAPLQRVTNKTNKVIASSVDQANDYDDLFGPTSPVKPFKKQDSMAIEDLWNEISNSPKPNDDSWFEENKGHSVYKDEAIKGSTAPVIKPKVVAKEASDDELFNQDIDDLFNDEQEPKLSNTKFDIENQEPNLLKSQKPSNTKRLAPSELFSFLDKIENQQSNSKQSKQKINPFSERTNISSLPSAPYMNSVGGSFNKTSRQKYSDMELENERDWQEDDCENLFNTSKISNKRTSLDKSYANGFGISESNRKSTSLADSNSKNSLLGSLNSKMDMKFKSSLRF